MWQGSKISLFVLLFYEGLNYHPDEFSFELLLRSELLTTRQKQNARMGLLVTGCAWPQGPHRQQQHRKRIEQ
jgi:hypothetical protein